jgi:hypothetical protein
METTMNDDFLGTDDDDLYELTDAEGKKNAKNVVNILLYLVLAAVVLITGAHAVMLVLSQTGNYTLAGESNMITTILTAIRVAFPLLVEAAAVVAGIGFIQSRWRKGQKTIGVGIELVWLLFAALNMITFFAVERGDPLQNWQMMWLQYGLPLSALVAGSLTYLLVRSDPEHKREQERVSAAESKAALRFNARRRAMLSPAMRRIEAQRAWVDVIKELKSAGYSRQQIEFMIQFTPELLMDNNGNGLSDILDDEPGRLSLADRLRGVIGNSAHDNGATQLAADGNGDVHLEPRGGGGDASRP